MNIDSPRLVAFLVSFPVPSLRLFFHPACRCFLALVGLPLVGSQPYAPQSPNAVTQDFAWTRIENLAGNQLSCLDADNDGTLWLGVNNEVVHYDGRTSMRYGREVGLSADRVLDLLVTRSGDLYVFQRRQISVHSEGRWRVLYEGVVNQEVMELAIEGADGTVWVAGDAGLFQVAAERVLLHPSGGLPLATVFEDHAGHLWTAVRDDGRTFRISREEGVLEDWHQWDVMLESTAQQSSRYGFIQSMDGLVWRFSTDPDDPTRSYDAFHRGWTVVDFQAFGSSNQVQAHYRTRDGMVWAVSDGVMHGLVDGEWTIHRPLSSHHGPMRANLTQSPNGDLWLLDYLVSLYRIDYSGQRWRSWNDLLFQLRDDRGAEWFISRDGRVVRRGTDGDQNWEAFGRADGVLDVPVAIKGMRDGGIWVIGSHDGAAAISIWSGSSRWTTLQYPALGESFFEDAFLKLADGDVLLSTARLEHWKPNANGALVRISPSGDVRSDSVKPSSFFPARVVGLKQGADGTIWINGGSVLLRWTGAAERPERVRVQGGVPIDDFWLQADGTIWVASWGAGVLRLRPSAGAEWENFSEREGLSSRFVSQLLVDEEREAVYALTSEGLDRYDGERWQSLGGATGLVNNRAASFLGSGREGEVWIAQGTHPWFMRAFAESTSLAPEGESFRSLVYQAETSAPETYLEVTHLPEASDRGLTVTCWGQDAWSDTPVNHLRYSYRLNDRPWSAFSSERIHSFHQLDVGPHVLQVRTRDRAFNIDPSPARLEFEVPPPMWRQPWFLALVTLVVLTIGLLVGIILRQRWRHLIEYDAQRISFFTNVSHELRTPLALIMAPLEKAVKVPADEEQAKDLALALRSAGRLNQLVDQLLDFRRIESGAMDLNPTEGDLVAHLREIIESFGSLAESKGQNLSFKCLHDTWPTLYDLDKLQKVVANLVVNALKYTPRHGMIRLILSLDGPSPARPGAGAVIQVEDDGQGISAGLQSHIFKPFSRGDSQAAREAIGTGLGLSLSSQLVRIMAGTISVTSPLYPTDAERPGTRFTVALPLPSFAARAEESSAPSRTGESAARIETAPIPLETNETGSPAELRILFIDDSEDMRDFLGRELAHRYAVTLAQDGLDGLKQARLLVPDLVIADVMMPRMNGIQFCRALKDDPSTSHIPVIMLTARSSSEFEQEGLESGADEYLAKPISLPKLELRIANVLETRRGLQERIRFQVMTERALPDRADPAALFLQRVVDVIEANLADGMCGVDQLAGEMGMSRSSFYRKFKAIAGEPPNDFIRDYRLRRAGQLLESTSLSVTDVMFEVGYAELGHFGKLFKASCGHSPTEHRARARRQAKVDQSGAE